MDVEEITVEKTTQETDQKTAQKTDHKTAHKTAQKTAQESTQESTQETVDKTVEKIFDLLDTNPEISQRELAELTGLSQKGIEWNIKKLKDMGSLERIGGSRNGHWEVISSHSERN